MFKKYRKRMRVYFWLMCLKEAQNAKKSTGDKGFELACRFFKFKANTTK